jgi:hypothetical protein
MENTLEGINVLGEYAKNIFPHIENTPVNIKLSLSRRILDQNEKYSDPKLPFSALSKGQQKPSQRYCPFKGAQAKRKHFVSKSPRYSNMIYSHVCIGQKNLFCLYLLCLSYRLVTYVFTVYNS